MPLRAGLQLLLACSSHPGAAFGPWSQPSVGMLKIRLLDISLSWDSFCRLASLRACSRCTLALVPSLPGASRRSGWIAAQSRWGRARSTCPSISATEIPATIPLASATPCLPSPASQVRPVHRFPWPFQGYQWGEAGREAWRSERNAIPFKAEGD